MFIPDTSSDACVVDETTKLQHTISEQESDKAKDLVLRTCLRMCEPKKANFWERSVMMSSSYTPLPENLERFADEHRAEFQTWLKAQVDRHQSDID